MEQLKLSITAAQAGSAAQTDVSAQGGSVRGRCNRGSPANYEILEMPRTPAKSSPAHSFPSTGAGRAILLSEGCPRKRNQQSEAQKQQQLLKMSGDTDGETELVCLGYEQDIVALKWTGLREKQNHLSWDKWTALLVNQSVGLQPLAVPVQ